MRRARARARRGPQDRRSAVAAETAAAALVERRGREEEVRGLEERLVVVRRVRGSPSPASRRRRPTRPGLRGAFGLHGRPRRRPRPRQGSLGRRWKARAKAHEIDALRQKSQRSSGTAGVAAAAGSGMWPGTGPPPEGGEEGFRRRRGASRPADEEEGGRGAEPEDCEGEGRVCATLESKKAGLKSALMEAEPFEQAKEKLANARLERARLETTLKEKERVEEEAKGKFDRAEAELSAVQALHLAAKFRDGEACPVCGVPR